jgi:hypothetical protein
MCKFIEDALEDIGDFVSDTVDYVFHGGLEDDVKEIGRDIDDFVNDVIPGGWAGVAGGALLAIGIYNPQLLGLAEAGTLTGEAVAAAGLDAGAIAADIAALAPEALVATEAAVASGVAPEIIAMANATLDPIAALNAAQGFTIADTAYLASIGAPEALIATATANNAALAAAGETAAVGGAEAGTTTAADGTTTQIFDDGSTLTTAADGTVTSTPATDVGTTGGTGGTGGNTTQTFDDGSTLTTDASGNVVSATDTAGKAVVPVVDAVAVPGAGAGTPDPTLGQSLKNYAGAVYDTLGPLGTAGLVAGAGSLLTPNLSGPIGSGTANYEWGTGTPLVNPGLNPGFIGYPASTPDYETTSPTQSQYYWGVRPPVTTEAELANFNQLPANAPVTPFGLANSAVGGTAQMNVPDFVSQYITNPAYAGVMSGTAPGYTAPVAPNELSLPGPSMAQQAMAARTTGPAVPA